MAIVNEPNLQDLSHNGIVWALADMISNLTLLDHVFVLIVTHFNWSPSLHFLQIPTEVERGFPNRTFNSPGFVSAASGTAVSQELLQVLGQSSCSLQA